MQDWCLNREIHNIHTINNNNTHKIKLHKISEISWYIYFIFNIYFLTADILLTDTHSRLHFFCINRSLQAVLYVESRMASKFCASEVKKVTHFSTSFHNFSHLKITIMLTGAVRSKVTQWSGLTHVCEDLLPIGHDIPPPARLLYHPTDR